MIEAEPVTWTNSVLPMAIIGVAAVVIPWLLVKRATRSQREVALTIWASAGLMLVVSGAVYAGLYAQRGHDVGGAFSTAPLATSWFFIGLAGYAAILWVPILGLVWFSMAQAVEKRKGEDIARKDRS